MFITNVRYDENKNAVGLPKCACGETFIELLGNGQRSRAVNNTTIKMPFHYARKRVLHTHEPTNQSALGVWIEQ